MKKTVKRMATILMAMAMLASIFCVNAFARSSDYLSAYSASCNTGSNGKITVTVNVDALGQMTEIGATKILLMKSTDGGTSFTTAATYNYQDFPNMMSTGIHFYKTVVTYYGTPGYKYCAIVYCHAGNSTGSDTKMYTTSAVTAVS